MVRSYLVSIDLFISSLSCQSNQPTSRSEINYTQRDAHTYNPTIVVRTVMHPPKTDEKKQQSLHVPKKHQSPQLHLYQSPALCRGKRSRSWGLYSSFRKRGPVGTIPYAFRDGCDLLCVFA